MAKLITIMRRAKKSGISRAEVLKTLYDGYEKSATEQGWRPSELAASKGEAERLADEVYGKEKSSA